MRENRIHNLNKFNKGTLSKSNILVEVSIYISLWNKVILHGTSTVTLVCLSQILPLTFEVISFLN